MAFAEKVVVAAHTISREDVEALRAHGFSDAEVLDIALAAGARSFFSRVLDAVGAEPDERLRDLEENLGRSLEVGRRFTDDPR